MAEKLFVGGLSFSTTSDRLREVFAEVGAVESAQVVTASGGHSQGFGFVEMATREEAEEAIRRLNRSDLDGRTITVELATSRGPLARGPRPVTGRGRS